MTAICGSLATVIGSPATLVVGSEVGQPRFDPELAASPHRPLSVVLDTVAGLSVKEAVDDLGAALIRRGRSANTVSTYRWGLLDLITFAANAGVHELADLTEDLLEDWQDSLIARNLAPSSRSVAATAAKALIRYASRKQLVDRALEDAVESVSVPQHLPRPIPNPSLATVLLALREAPEEATLGQLRNRCLFMYLLTTGARVSEILRIRRDDYERPIVRQKGHTEKKLYPPPAVVTACRQYLALRCDSLPQLFVTHARGVCPGPMSPDAVRAVWRRLAKDLGLQRWTTHQVRHTSASILSDADVADLVIAEHLGHHGLGSLPNYAQISERRRDRVVDIFERLTAPAEQPPSGSRELTARIKCLSVLNLRAAVERVFHVAAAKGSDQPRRHPGIELLLVDP